MPAPTHIPDKFLPLSGRILDKATLPGAKVNSTLGLETLILRNQLFSQIKKLTHGFGGSLDHGGYSVTTVFGRCQSQARIKEGDVNVSRCHKISLNRLNLVRRTHGLVHFYRLTRRSKLQEDIPKTGLYIGLNLPIRLGLLSVND